MHILFLTDNFPPEVNAPASRTFEHCREWVRAGHRVTVITCVPNFPKGQVYEGYCNCLRPQREVMEGIEVVRVWSYIAPNRGFARRVLDYMSFMASSSLAATGVRGVDVVVGTSPQFFTACAAWFVGLYKRVPYVFELRDLWPESIRAVGAMRDSFVLRLLERLELFLYRKAALIVSVTESFRDNLIARGIDGGKIAVVTNGVDVSRFQPQPKDAELVATLGLQGKFVAGYIGTHGMAHALDTLIEAARRLRDVDGGDRFRLLLLGDGAMKAGLQRRAAELGLDNVVFLDSVPKAEVVRYWSLLDVSIIHLKRTELFQTVIPSKLFESMGMGVPVLLGVAGEAAQIVERNEVGVCFEPENADDLIERMIALAGDAAMLDRLRANCTQASGRFDRRLLAAQMLELLSGVAKRGGSGR
ncbi:MAG: glycosyltransferase family 4 protein [Ectothiorhodospiraceae bacterium]|jgi:glycosyltransferase involved in cell wall biosynthesis|nr:glycosyltransferase family 4 protein [Ectothiorhodospiraceae bacterium]